MTNEVNFSLEETNAIRKQLGLKLIDSEPASHVEQRKESRKKFHRNDSEFQFIDDGKISRLRKRLASLRNTSNFSFSSIDDENWLSKIGTGKKHKPVRVVHEDDEEDKSPSLKISHGIDEIASKNGTILTLKEQLVHDEEANDILEDVALVQSQKEHENVTLKKLSRWSHLKPLRTSSFELDKIEQSKNGVYELVTDAEDELNRKDRTISEGKVKVEFDDEKGDGDGDGDGDCRGDFQPIKIKKRSKKDVRSRIKFPPQIKPVVLVDEDEKTEDFQQQQIEAYSKPILKSRMHTPYEIARQIQKEKSEREDRALNLDRLSRQSQVVIDENVQFLESFKANIVTSSNEKEDPQDLTQREVRTAVSVPSDGVADLESETPDFSAGLASTLHFLQKKELLPLPHVQDDNTGINLIYRHENGAQLTAKEAYKRLSQRFHGTRSSRKKKEKFESKLRARQRNITDDHEGKFQI